MCAIVEPLDGIYWQNGVSNLEVATAIGEPNSGICYRKSYNGSFSEIMEGSCVEKSYRICKKEIVSDNCFLDGFTINPIVKVIDEMPVSDVFECRQQCQDHQHCAVATFRKGSKVCQLHNHGM